MLGRFAGVSLVYDGTHYTGAVFNVAAGHSLTVEFSAGLDAAGLEARLGNMAGTNSDALASLFEGGSAPATATTAALGATGLGYVDDLFELDGDDPGITAGNILPTELL